MSTISIVIPAYKEDFELNKLLNFITKKGSRVNIKEIIVVDFDNSSIVHNQPLVQVIQSPKKGRPSQLNFGAQKANGEIIYFLHADSKPPEDFDNLIIDALNEDYKAGCFRLAFDTPHPMLKFFAWFTRFNINICRGGDQSLFVERECYHESGGYNAELSIMEDIEIIRRLRDKTKFVIIDRQIITSARKYTMNGYYKLQWIFFKLYVMYVLGNSQEHMISYYKKNII
ncbi:MAG: rSAM/selenodomain-associated transferase 2 [Patiriisocius sp.]|jgi:rSAM/selenodomain-associated transferase 2